MNLTDLTRQEAERQRTTLNLIASENYPSPTVLELLGGVWSNKYGEGYPGKRYYAGNQHTDELESFVQQKALQVYGAGDEYGVNVQVLSGSPANAMVFLSILNSGDTILSLNLANGGHLSHLHQTSNWNKFFNHVSYDVKEVSDHTFEIDVDDYTQKLKEYQPKLVIIGFSAYPRAYQFGQMCELAHEIGAFVLADVAHINGLIAAGLHDTPFGTGSRSADFVSMTTHKTFRGPRGAMLFAKSSIPEYLTYHFDHLEKKPAGLINIINKTVFPGTSGGPHFNKIAAIGRACQEILGEEQYPDGVDFKTYSQDVLNNTVEFEKGLADGGLTIISPTQNHLCLAKLPDELDSLEIQKKLEDVGVITNRNSIPFDTKSPWRPGGMRFGLAPLSSRGITTQQSHDLGEAVAQYILDDVSESDMNNHVHTLVQSLKWYY
jgi:glycine hydroxymethyltransferase